MPAFTRSFRCQASSMIWAKEGHQTPHTKVLPTPTQDPLAARKKISQAFLWEAEAWI